MTNTVFSFTKTQMIEAIEGVFSQLFLEEDLPPSNFIVGMAMQSLPITPDEFDAAWQCMSEYVRENYADSID